MRARVLVVLAALVALVSLPSAIATAGRLVTGKDVKDSSLTGKDVKDGSLLAGDLKAGSLPAGPTGPSGPAGHDGVAGPRGFSAWDPIPSGTTVVGPFQYDSTSGTAHVDDYLVVTLPGVAPAHLQATQVNFDNDASGVTTDDDPACTGSAANPTAPPGRVCLYVIETGGLASAQGLTDDNGANSVLESRGFSIEVATDADNADTYLKGAWAYTAP